MNDDTRLDATLRRLDALLDWERRERAQMRVDLAPVSDLLQRLEQRSKHSVRCTSPAPRAKAASRWWLPACAAPACAPAATPRRMSSAWPNVS